MSQARVEPPLCYWIWGTRFPVDAPSSDRRGPHRARHHRPPPPRPDPSRRMVCGVENMEAPPLRRGTPYPVTYNVVSYNGGYASFTVRCVRACLLACPPRPLSVSVRRGHL